MEKIENVSFGLFNQTQFPLESGYLETDPKLTITGSINKSKETAKKPAIKA
jgi:hypothetical protein